MECDGSGPGSWVGTSAQGLPPPTSPGWGRGGAAPDRLIPTVGFRLGETLLALTPPSTLSSTHTLHGSQPDGCQAKEKEGLSFCAPPCQARGLDPFYLILAAWAERVPASGALAESVLHQPLQLPEQELNVQ